MEEAVKQLLASLGFNELSEVRYQVINIATANPAAASTLTESSIQLDRDYNRVVGIGYFEVANGGIANNYNIGARTNRKTWVDDINIQAWENNGVAPNMKFLRANIPYGSGDTFYARILTNATAGASAISGQMVVILKRDLTEIPK